MHTVAGERIQVCGQRRDQRLALAGTHFGDLAVMQDHAAYQLHVEVAHVEDTLSRLAHNSKGLGQDVIETFTAGDARLERRSFCDQIGVRERRHQRLKRVDGRYLAGVLLDQAVVAATENRLEDAGNHRGGRENLRKAEILARRTACFPVKGWRREIQIENPGTSPIKRLEQALGAGR